MYEDDISAVAETSTDGSVGEWFSDNSAGILNIVDKIFGAVQSAINGGKGSSGASSTGGTTPLKTTAGGDQSTMMFAVLALALVVMMSGRR